MSRMLPSDEIQIVQDEIKDAIKDGSAAAHVHTAAQPGPNDFFADCCDDKLSSDQMGEVDRYRTTQFTSEQKAMCPIKFWYSQSSTFPALAKYAIEILTVPASSILIEEYFSQSGLLLSPQRTRFLPEKANKCMFLNINSDL